MISLCRDLARRLRAILRKAGASKNNRPLLELTSDRGELRCRAQLPELAIEFNQPDSQDQESILVPWEALDDFDGKSALTFVRATLGVEVAWEDGGIPFRKTYAAPTAAPSVPNIEGTAKVVVPGLLQALAHASLCAGADGQSRYAVHRIQIRGAQGEIVASDGRQALIQNGFTFPWQEDALIAGAAVFGGRELPLDLPATVCKSASHLVVEVGGWTIYLAIDSVGRFPNVANVVPPVPPGASTLHLASQDAAFLTKALAKLPGSHDEGAPITVDLNGQVALRAKEEGQPPTEVILAGSAAEGAPARLNCDRRFLARAVALGFTTMSIVGPDKPVVCQDKTRTYLWVPLPATSAIAPCEAATKITTQDSTQTISSTTAPQPAATPNPIQERKDFPMIPVHSNGSTHGQDSGLETSTKANTLAGLIGEAQSLRDHLRDGYMRANRLLGSLKNHRKQSRLVASTLASLRQLQQIEG